MERVTSGPYLDLRRRIVDWSSGRELVKRSKWEEKNDGPGGSFLLSPLWNMRDVMMIAKHKEARIRNHVCIIHKC
ncbi:hypothetical protein Hanom_Chr16g01427121 [Helianthus anomalus]